jgi:hypothetical protein
MNTNTTFTRNESNTSWTPVARMEYSSVTSSPTQYLLANMSTSQELAKKRSKNKRKAVVVGINKYTKLDGANLAGCVNDAKDFANTLLINGFPPTRIKLLVDEKATRANIMKKLEWLVQDTKPGDVLVYYHSGHGSQITDVDGDEEEDRYDEMLIPSDFIWDDPKTHLTDDDLHEFFTGKTPEGVRCDVILDTCFSGTGTRSLLKQPVDLLDAKYRTAKFLPRPVDQQMRLNTMIPAETKVNKIGSKLLKSQHNTLHSACSENQVAWEMANEAGEVRGVFTYDYCQILRRSNGNKTRREMYQILRNSLANAGAEQIPQLEVGNEAAYDQYPFRREHEDEDIEVTNE